MQAFDPNQNRMVDVAGFIESTGDSSGLYACTELGVVEVELDPSPTIVRVASLAGLSLMESFINEGADDKHILKAVFVVGSTGAGKSKVAERMFAGTGMKFINQDRHLEAMLRKAMGSLSDAGALGYLATQKARDISIKERDQYARRRLGLVIDATGWAYERIATPNAMLKSLGYDTYMVLVDVEYGTAFKRNEARGNAGGRRVPEMYLKDAFVGLNLNRKKYASLFGKNFYVIDNNKDRAPADWEGTVGRYADRVARAILSQTVKNPKGKAWVNGAKSDGAATARKPVAKAKAPPKTAKREGRPPPLVESFHDVLRNVIVIEGALPDNVDGVFNRLCITANETGCRRFDNPHDDPTIHALVEDGSLIMDGDFLTFAKVKYERPSVVGMFLGE